MNSDNIDNKFTQAWERGKQLYDLKPLLPCQSDEANTESSQHEYNVAIPETLKQLIESQDNKDQLHEELKELLMQWFWTGYYKGFDIS